VGGLILIVCPPVVVVVAVGIAANRGIVCDVVTKGTTQPPERLAPWIPLLYRQTHVRTVNDRPTCACNRQAKVAGD
jgi:hypothetical protein